MDYRFEKCCEALYLHEIAGMTFQAIAKIQHVRTFVSQYMAGMAMGLDRSVVYEVGKKQVIERYKMEVALKGVAA